ncbi:helix-turn-helix domain-containing protein [Pseudoalteromonas pernae]|uniref:helix-turn-helix domain-containing protein n=1 Tax=Pseudoalteromonas pernae TaxID=3118054 RepID=UPI003241DA03
MELAEQLLKLRKEQQWTQAFAAREIGIQQSYLSKLENNKLVPSPEVIEKLAATYGVPINSLMPRRVPPITKSESLLLVVIFVLLIGAASISACAMFEVMYPQTYYTYQFTSSNQEHNLRGYHLTQEYLGEAAMSEDQSTHYTIIGERNISRDENRWLYAIGAVLLVAAVFLLMLLMMRRKRNMSH